MGRFLPSRKFWPWLGFLLVWVLPAALWVGRENGLKFAIAVVVVQCLMLSLYQSVMLLRQRKFAVLRWALKGGAGVMILLHLAGMLYGFVQGFALDPFFALDAMNEVVPTLLHSFGLWLLLLAVVGILAVWAGCLWGLGRLKHAYVWRGVLVPLGWLVPVVMLLVGWQVMPGPLLKGLLPFLQVNRLYSERETIKGLRINTNAGVVTKEWGKFRSDDSSVFILQLESGNAMALAGLATKRSGLEPQQLMPWMMRLKQQGVMAPFMWGATMQTHRGQGAILCSAVLDVYAGISNSSETPAQCLPQMLSKQGYNTVFMSAYPNPGFANTQNFMHKIGFKETHFGDKMKPGDARYEWGYDDCDFYDRYFDYLDKAFGESMNRKFFGYFALVANHDPFDHKPNFKQYEPFPKPKNMGEKYLNSFAAQDHCLVHFMKRINPYRQNAHIIIVADHSWPVGIRGGSVASERGVAPDNFLIPFIYLPPRGRAAEFRTDSMITEPVPGQVDILPTVLELLSGKYYPNSFATLLKATQDGREPKLPPDYDDCQVMTQPYDGTKITVVRGAEKVSYNRGSGKLRKTMLGEEFAESEPVPFEDGRLVKNLSYGAFLNQYLCDRDKYWFKKVKGVPRAVGHSTSKWVF